MRNEDFAVFILTHGRPNNVKTLNTLLKHGYTGKIYLIIDDEDKMQSEYCKNFGDKIISFSKNNIAQTFDEADNFDNRKTIVYARNACFEIAMKLGLNYFVQLDDDYVSFEHRYVEEDKLMVKKIKNLDIIFEYFISFMSTTQTSTLAMAQGGDFIGGINNSMIIEGGLKRKAMNSFFCSSQRPFKFTGRINEDVNTYILNGSRGELFFTISLASITQTATQSNSGGMTDVYLVSGTYIKSFYSVLINPSSVKVKLITGKHNRLHHSIDWDCAVPKILNERHKINV